MPLYPLLRRGAEDGEVLWRRKLAGRRELGFGFDPA